MVPHRSNAQARNICAHLPWCGQNERMNGPASAINDRLQCAVRRADSPKWQTRGETRRTGLGELTFLMLFVISITPILQSANDAIHIVNQFHRYYLIANSRPFMLRPDFRCGFISSDEWTGRAHGDTMQTDAHQIGSAGPIMGRIHRKSRSALRFASVNRKRPRRGGARLSALQSGVYYYSCSGNCIFGEFAPRMAGFFIEIMSQSCRASRRPSIINVAQRRTNVWMDGFRNGMPPRAQMQGNV